MHKYTVTLCLTDTLAGFDFVTKTVYADHAHAAIMQATAFTHQGRVIVLETECLGNVKVWMDLDELEWHLAA